MTQNVISTQFLQNLRRIVGTERIQKTWDSRVSIPIGNGNQTIVSQTEVEIAQLFHKTVAEVGARSVSLYDHAIGKADTETLGELLAFRIGLNPGSDTVNGFHGRYSEKAMPVKSDSDKSNYLSIIQGAQKAYIGPAENGPYQIDTIDSLVNRKFIDSTALSGRVMQNGDYLILEVDNRDVLGSIEEDAAKFEKIWEETGVQVPSDTREEILNRISFVFTKHEPIQGHHFLAQLTDWAQPRQQIAFRANYPYVIELIAETLDAYGRYRDYARRESYLLVMQSQRAMIDLDLELARQIQRGSLLPLPPTVNFDIAYACRPARMVSGDTVGVKFNQDVHSLTCFVADVKGKGIPSALTGQRIHTLFCDGKWRTVLEFHEMANRNLYDASLDKNDTQSATAFTFELNAYLEMEWARAGHEVPFLIRQGKLSQPFENCHWALAYFAENNVVTKTSQCYPGDVIVTISDGFEDRRDHNDNRFGGERVSDVISNHGHLPAKGIIDALERELDNYSGGSELRDDQTVLVVRLKDRMTHSFTIPFIPNMAPARVRMRDIIPDIGNILLPYESREDELDRIFRKINNQAHRGVSANHSTEKIVQSLVNTVRPTLVAKSLGTMDEDLIKLRESFRKYVLMTAFNSATNRIMNISGHFLADPEAAQNFDKLPKWLSSLIGKLDVAASYQDLLVNLHLDKPITWDEAGNGIVPLAVELQYQPNGPMTSAQLKRLQRGLPSGITIGEVNDHPGGARSLVLRLQNS